MTLPCPQCGAEIRIQETSGFVRCPFCGTSLVLEVSGVRPHVLYRPRVRAADLLPILRRFCDAAGLPRPTPLGSHLVYYPFWRYATRGRPRLVGAWPTIDSRWREVEAPDAEQSLYDPALIGNASVIEGSIEEPAARARIAGAGEIPPGDLVHLPFYEAAARVGTSRVEVSVDACSGRVYARGIPEGSRAGRPAVGPWLPAVGFLVMLAGAALLPTWWLAGAAVLPLAILLYSALIARERG